MATKAGFKQECTACGAMVAVKDTSFIGKKIDCPKCKLRFVVEDPDAGDEEVKPAKGKASAVTAKKPTNGKATNGTAVKKKPGLKARSADDDEDDRPSPKKKKQGGSTMLLGLALGGVALLLIVAGVVVFLMMGDDKKPSAGGP